MIAPRVPGMGNAWSVARLRPRLIVRMSPVERSLLFDSFFCLRSATRGGTSGDAVLRGGNGAKVSQSFCTVSTALHHGFGPSPSKRGCSGGTEGEAAAMLCTVSTGSRV